MAGKERRVEPRPPADGPDADLRAARLRVARDVAEELRSVEVVEPGLSGGAAGLAVAFDRFDAAWPGEGFGVLADARLDLALARLSRERLRASLYDGVAGIAWAVALLPERAGQRRLRFLEEEVDPLLLGYLGRSPWRADYDLVSGLVGIGVYALERVKTESGRALLAAVLERLDELAIESDGGVTWHTGAHLLPHWQRELSPSGHVDLGLAHGVAGVVSLLAGACASAVAGEMARPLLDRAVAWLLEQDREEGFPHWVVEGRGSGRSRAAWCYGDPGIAAALLLAARATGRGDWEQRALAVARRAAARARVDGGVRDVPICHGAAGLAHVFGRLSAATGDAVLAAAASDWLDRTLAMREVERPIAGFPFRLPGADGEFTPEARAGLLEGAAGVSLVLLTADSPGDALWDRFLLLSAPGLP